MTGQRQALVGLAVAALAVGCGGSERPAVPARVATVPARELVAPGELRVCADFASPPFTFRERGERSGFEVELLRALAPRLGLGLSWVDVSRGRVAARLAAGACDVGVSRLRVTLELQSTIGMLGYVSTGLAFLAKYPVDSPCRKLVGVVRGTKGADAIGEVGRKGCGRVRTFPTSDAAAAALRRGGVEAVLDDTPVTIWYVDQGGLVSHLVPKIRGRYGIGYRLRRHEVLFALRGALQDLHESGAMRALLARWELTDTVDVLGLS